MQIALQPLLASDPAFAFEHLDVMAYPRAAPDQSPPCGLRLETWDADRIGLLLNAAGMERLRRKAERMAAAIAARGAEQVFYEEFLCALGYKHNRQPFRELAARVPRAALLESTGGNLTAVYALLAGVAGLLPTDAPDKSGGACAAGLLGKYRDAWEHVFTASAHIEWLRRRTTPAD